MTGSLFESAEGGYEPLAARMRPRTLAQYLGQDHILAPGKPLRQALERGQPHSMILWGPPGVGKTTLAKLVADCFSARLEVVSAVLAGVKEVREAVARAKMARQQQGAQTVLFVDEVHRFNKSQQDAFLPHIEDGTLLFIGATTENPSFELNNALLSRAKVYLLKPLELSHLKALLKQALNSSEGLAERHLQLSSEAEKLLIHASDGDGRKLLNLLEISADLVEDSSLIKAEDIATLLQDMPRRFDKRGDDFYDQLSAFHKSVRGSSPDGALYWFARMLDGGADPLVIARRLLAIASEDVGNADPRALPLCIAAWDTFTRLGGEDGTRAIAQAAVYCACAPKSNAVYKAWKAARDHVRETGSLPVPSHLRNAPTSLMADLGYGKEYRYAHNEPDAYAAGENYFPEELDSRHYYEPEPRGLEIRIGEKLKHLKQLDSESQQQR